MGITKVSQSFVAQVSPDRIFKALVMDSHNLCPKLMFSSIKSIEFLKGQGEVGSIRQMNLTDVSPLKYVKYRMDEIDEKNYTCKYTMIEFGGDVNLMDKIEYITHELKFERYGLRGCVCKEISEYKTKGDEELNEEEIEHGKDRAVGVYEVVEAYLLAHPHAYT